MKRLCSLLKKKKIFKLVFLYAFKNLTINYTSTPDLQPLVWEIGLAIQGKNLTNFIFQSFLILRKFAVEKSREKMIYLKLHIFLSGEFNQSTFSQVYKFKFFFCIFDNFFFKIVILFLSINLYQILYILTWFYTLMTYECARFIEYPLTVKLCVGVWIWKDISHWTINRSYQIMIGYGYINHSFFLNIPLFFLGGKRERTIHSWHGFTENGPCRNIAQLWKLFSYITIGILLISFRNCVSSLLSTHYRKFLFTGPFDLNKA